MEYNKHTITRPSHLNSIFIGSRHVLKVEQLDCNDSNVTQQQNNAIKITYTLIRNTQ